MKQHRQKKYGEAFWNLFYPKRCPLCEEILESFEEICVDCRQKLVYIHEPKCKKCGKAFEIQPGKDIYPEYCADCSRIRHSFDVGMAVFQYQEGIRESIYRFKYSNQRTYAAFYAQAMAYRYGRTLRSWGIEIIIPVPVSKEKKQSRGYNQAALLAKELSERLQIPYGEELVRVKNTIPQKELSPTERKTNLKNAFKMKQNIVKYKKVLLVDDIYTTGSTMDACATVLKQAGAGQVYCICLAIGEGI